MELYDLFKRSRASATATQPRFEVSEIESEEVDMNPLSEQGTDSIQETSTGVSYLPKITPIPRKGKKKASTGGFAVRKDTLIVGAVFVGVLVGFSFLLGRHTNVGAEPASSPETTITAPGVHVPDKNEIPAPVVPAVIPAAPMARKAPVVAKEPEVKKEEAPTPPPAAEPKKDTHVYQLATTGLGEDGQMWAEKYKEFLVGSGYDGFTYQTQKGWWTVRVRSTDKTQADLEKIQQLAFRGHKPFLTAMRLPD
jgi:hypothetical protein